MKQEKQLEKLDYMYQEIQKLAEVVQKYVELNERKNESVCACSREENIVDKRVMDTYNIVKRMKYESELKEINEKIEKAKAEREKLEEEIRCLEAEKIFADERYYREE